MTRFLGLLCCVLLLGSAQGPPKPAGSARKPQTRGKSSTRDGGSAVPKVNYNGKWAGTTGQGRAIAFTVVGGSITDFAAEATLEGDVCSTTTKVTSNLQAPITKGSAAGDVRSGAGGVSLTMTASFTSSARASGSMSFQLEPIPGPPPGVPGHVPSCAAFADTVWTATREGATAAELAPTAPAPLTGPCRTPTTAGFREEPPEEEQLPGTTRFYLAITGNTCYGPCAYLSTSDPSRRVGSGIDSVTYERSLIGDMQGTTYRLGLSMRSANPQHPSVESNDDPPGKLSATVVLRRNGQETVLASSTFTTGPEDKRQLAVVAGIDPDAREGDTLVVRTKWLEGANSINPGSWVEVPQTPIKESAADLENAVWTITGRVSGSDGRGQPGRRVMFSPLDASGSAAKLYWRDRDGKMPLRNPRRTTDADGRFKIRLDRAFFNRGGGAALAGEAVVVEDCEGSDPRPVGTPLQFTLQDDKREIDLGALSVP